MHDQSFQAISRPAREHRKYFLTALALFGVLCSAKAQFRDAIVVTHGPNVSGKVSGSVQVLQGEAMTFSGTSTISGQLRVPGAPKIVTTGHATIGEVESGGGSQQPSNYTLTASGNASIAEVLLQTDPVAVPVLPPIVAPTGSRSVQITSPDQQIGDSRTLLNLSVGGSAGTVTLPPGSYGAIRVQAGAKLVLGTVGATIPARYDFQSFTVDGSGAVSFAGPVVVDINSALTISGTVGAPETCGLALIGIANGDLTVSGNGALYGHLICPNGTATFSGNATAVGGLASERLAINGNATFEVRPDVPPTATIASPADGTVFVAPATVPLATNAADADGTVASVAYYEGEQQIGQSSTAPFAMQWINVPSGVHHVIATATDNLGVSTQSDPVTVISDIPPVVSLQSPSSGALFAAPASIQLQAAASDADGTVTKVEFYQGTVKIGETTNSPFQFTWTNVASGNYAITAIATDNWGLSTPSMPVTIRVDNPPTVSITAPAANTSFNAPASITISATAADTDGSVQKVEFFQGGTKLGEADAAPFTFTWNNVAAGNYTLSAVATDDVGLTASSTTVNVAVNDSVTAQDLQNTPWQGSDTYKRNRILLVRDVIAQANQPVSFYGRVVDQSGQPIVGTAVTVSVRSTAEPLPGDSEDIVTPYNLTTDSNGQFQVTNIKGSLLTVEALAKDGYEAPDPIPGEYWYSASMGNSLFTPNADKPEVFTMWKLAGAQTLIVKSISAQANYDGTPVYVNLVNGRIVQSGGDIKISVVRNPAVLAPGQNQYDWTATISAVAGGVIVSHDAFMYVAPSTGYQSQVTLGFNASDSQWTSVQSVPLYVQSRNGQNYARVYLTIGTSPDDKPWAAVSMQSYLNNAGATNLEYNPNQDIQLSQ